jgi:hypothetical protein
VPKLIGFVAHGVAMIRRHHFAVFVDGGEDHEMGAGAERADLGDFRRAEAAGERKLAVVAHILAAKHQNRMLLEGGAHRAIDGIVGRDIRQRDAAHFGGKARTKRNDLHRSILPMSVLFGQASPKTGDLAR